MRVRVRVCACASSTPPTVWVALLVMSMIEIQLYRWVAIGGTQGTSLVFIMWSKFNQLLNWLICFFRNIASRRRHPLVFHSLRGLGLQLVGK